MSGDWRQSTWGREVSLEYGKALRGHDTSSGSYRVFGSNGPIGWTNQPLVDGPGVILGRKGAYRGVQYSRAPFFVIDTAYYVVPKSELDLRWLYYAIKHHRLGEIDDGSPIPSTTRAAVYVRPLAVPPLAEQRVIARILGTLDDKIELNRKMNETLEAMARALFKSWFEHEWAGRAGQETVVAELASCGVLQVGDGYRAKNDEMAAEGLPFARAGNIDNGFSFDGADLLSAAGIEKAGEKVSRAFDVVFTSKGTVGRFAFVDPAMGRFVYSPQLCFWRSTNHEALNPHVLFQWMRSRWFLDQVDRVKGQTDMAEYVSLRDQRAMRLPLMTPASQQKIGIQLADLQSLVWNNQRESKTLRALRDELLPKLLSGELSTRALESEVAAAV